MSEIRINKFLSQSGYCSRRKADNLIEKNRVTINGKVPEMGTRVKPGDIVAVDGKKVNTKGVKNIYIVFNKPRGIVCTTDRGVEKNNIVDFINYPERIYPVGRLDKNSEGLIMMTNDGAIVNKIIHARNQHEKEYVVKVNQPITKEFIDKMRNGVPILDTMTHKCDVEQLGNKTFRIVLTQGLNRQIRRMCEYFGYRVVKLKRIRIMNIQLDLESGKWRHLTDKEKTELGKQINHHFE